MAIRQIFKKGVTRDSTGIKATRIIRAIKKAFIVPTWYFIIIDKLTDGVKLLVWRAPVENLCHLRLGFFLIAEYLF